MVEVVLFCFTLFNTIISFVINAYNIVTIVKSRQKEKDSRNKNKTEV